MDRKEELNNEFRIVRIERPAEMPTFKDNMENQWETIMKAFRFGKLGMIIFSLIICLQMPGNTSLKSRVAIVLLKIIQYIFFKVLGVKIKSSEHALELLETFYYKTQRIYDNTFKDNFNLGTEKEETFITNLRKKLLL